ncbi:FIST signal transduction protein [Ideonella sp. BN130291]|uniref:FIST signal transduction protein n=1 Tax=Ideonella sp. BN130291 TaxID=3112940 RepID=UPI002E263D59|nr:FIST N-terminal domain-containing protein [Ideonella sp. BN130291]
MSAFWHGHAGDADWQAALRQAAGQVEHQRRATNDAHSPTLGFLYFTDHHRPQASALLAAVQRQWPGVAWAGAMGVGVAANGVEYFGTPGLSLMLAALPTDQFRVFSGAQPLGRFPAHTALVHADPATPDLQELIAEMSERTASGYLFGGLASAREGGALHVADGVFEGGLSGVAFSSAVTLVSRVTQGSQPVGPVHEVTEVDGNVILTLDGQPALQVLLADTGISLQRPQHAFARLRDTLIGVSEAHETAVSQAGAFGVDTLVRHLVGLDPGREAIAIADELHEGMQLAFCTRHAEAARRDLVRICSEIREELAPHAALDVAVRDTLATPAPGAGQRIAGAVYVSCAGRGGPHFGAPSAELQILRHALGDVPLVGFFAAGEIARHHLYGYTGVLTVFVDD